VILDEFIISGEVQETSKNRVMSSIKKMQEVEAIESAEMDSGNSIKGILG
jgi:hypothetical protein